jgi:hypothetical protein
MPFTTKTWANSPTETTPISAAGLIDLEQRLAAYADSVSGSSLLGSVSKTTDFVSSGASIQDVTDMSVSVTIGTRPVIVEVAGWTLAIASGTATVTMEINDVTAGAAIRNAGGAYSSGVFHAFPSLRVLVTPAAGARTYKMRITVTSSTATLYANATSPMQLMVFEV